MAYPQFRPLTLAITGGVVGAIIGLLIGGYFGRLILGAFLETPPPADEIEALRNLPARLEAIPVFWGGVLGIIVCSILGAAGGVALGWAIAERLLLESQPADPAPLAEANPKAEMPTRTE